METRGVVARFDPRRIVRRACSLPGAKIRLVSSWNAICFCIFDVDIRTRRRGRGPFVFSFPFFGLRAGPGRGRAGTLKRVKPPKRGPSDISHRKYSSLATIISTNKDVHR